MLKLISLQGFLNLSDDAIKKIADGLEAVGLEKDGVLKFDDADDFLDAVGIAVDEQHTVVVAVENEEYNVIKKQIIGKFSLDSKSSPDIAEAISREREELLEGRLPDMEDHCLVPSDAEIYLTDDGLYSGFFVEFANGAKLIYVPLDMTRLDTLLGYIREELGEKDKEEPEKKKDDPNTRVLFSIFDDDNEAPVDEEPEAEVEENDQPEEEPVDLTGFEEAVSNAGKAAYSLIQLDKTVAFVDCEYSKYLKAMSKKVDGLADSFSFNEVELEGEEELEPQVALARKTRLALRNTGADFGAAISPILEGEKDGKPFYYSYIIIHDGTSAKAKKVSTSSQQGAESLIPHAFSLMFELIAQKAEILTAQEDEEEAAEETEKKKRIIILSAVVAVAVVAIITAVVLVWKYVRAGSDIYNPSSSQNSLSVSNQSAGNSLQPSNDVPAITAGNSVSNTGNLTTDPNYAYPAEPTAGNVSANNTVSPIASQSGTFTFTVYGYGHGVGMSQTGANYYASIGWNYLEILAMYYYGTNLVIGDTYPATVSFAGTSYSTRDYLAIAVESEMGSSFETEALKAQAVALYTYAKYCNYNVSVTAHAFDKTPSEKSYAAVDAVIGQYVTYNGEVCQTLFHATSAYKTASFSSTFGGEQIAYLSGGRPSYGDVKAENYMTTVTFSSDELKALIYSKTGIQLSGDPSTWLKIISHDACINNDIGYVSYIQVGNQVYTGYKFRLDVLGGAIRSHCFTINYTPDTAVQ
ncbi:MAG: SpoIID/LytB domain-containing protein [Acutalibacteraceae bacterium]